MTETEVRAEKKKKQVMTWCHDKDVMMLRVVVTEEVFTYKFGSRERGKAWQEVADELNCHPCFIVTAWSVRNRYTILSKKLKRTNLKEKKESGGGRDEQPSEMENLLEDLGRNIRSKYREKKRKEESDKKRKESEQEKNKGHEMRDKALERFGETRKRHAADGDGEVTENKRRQSSSDTLEWLRERSIEERKLKEEKQKQKSEELDTIRRQQMELTQQLVNQQQLQQQQIQQQIQHPQQQQQQQFIMMQQQMLAVIQQLSTKNI